MSSFGKKILSAFVDLNEETSAEEKEPSSSPLQNQPSLPVSEVNQEKFRIYFEKMFRESNRPGPDYYEFSKMIEAMQSISDEKTRYVSAFAGLSVQGLDKKKLVESAAEYIKILDADAANFSSTINTAVSEKVEQKKKQLEEKTRKIQELTREINDLNNSIIELGNEIKENEERISNNLSAYASESERFKTKIHEDIQKINSLL